MTEKHTTTYQTTEVESNNVILTDIEQQAIEMKSLTDFDWYVRYCNLRRGDIVIFRRIEITAEIETSREYRYGFSGQERERCASKTQRTLSEETLKLWKTKKRGWYWK